MLKQTLFKALVKRVLKIRAEDQGPGVQRGVISPNRSISRRICCCKYSNSIGVGDRRQGATAPQTFEKCAKFGLNRAEIRFKRALTLQVGNNLMGFASIYLNLKLCFSPHSVVIEP